MQITRGTFRKAAAIVSIFFLPVFSLNTYALSTKEIESSKQLNKNLEQMCHNEELLSISKVPAKNATGKLSRYFYLKIKDEENPKAEPRIFDCTGFGVGPMLETDYEKYHSDPSSGICNSCSNGQVDFAKIIALQENVEDAVAKVTCDQKQTVKITSQSCLKDIACNIGKSLFAITPGGSIATMILASPKAKSPQVMGCNMTGTSNCAQELVAGILKNVWDMVYGIGYLAKGAAFGIAGKIQSWFSSSDVQSVENKLSEASIIASAQSPFSITKFLKDAGSYLLEFIEGFITSQWNSISEFTGCEKWDGVPHLSKCQKPYESWRCSSCEQRLNAVCGMVGALGSELIVAYFTGGAVNAIAKSEKFAKAAEVVSKIIRGGNESALIRRTVQAGAFVGRPAVALGKGLFKAFELLNKVPPFKQWAYLNERAFLAGLEGRGVTSPVVEKALTASKDTKPGGQTSLPKGHAEPPQLPIGEGAKEILEQAKKSPELRHQLEVAGDATADILRLPADEAKRVLETVEKFSPEELQVFVEEVKKPGWKWCR